MPTALDIRLARTVEQALEPALPICDPHHHLWDDPRHPLAPYMLDELRRDTGAGHNVRRTVFVDCMSHYRTEGSEALRPVGEIEFARQVAEASARPLAEGQVSGAEIAGLVGFADMMLGDRAMPVLEAEIEAGGGRFRGIRHATGWDPNEQIRSYRNSPAGLLLDNTFRRGVACLDRLGLSFDTQVNHHQLLEVASLACAFPRLPIIVNHTGVPIGIGPYASKRDEVFRHWRGGIAELAAHENVFMKLGGLQMHVCGFDWTEREVPPGSEEIARASAPYYRACIELLGAGRCMFESNFPVDRLACSYTVLWNAFKRVAQDLSASEKADLFHDTAARAYRL
jgi:L-fuconolactonase